MEFSRTRRQIAMQQQMQVKHEIEPVHVAIEKWGNADTKILAKAFEAFAEKGITSDAREKIEKLDDILKGADIVISKDGKIATIAQDDGRSFKIDAPNTSNRTR